jgi:uncharacterized protein
LDEQFHVGGQSMTEATTQLAPLANQWSVLLTTYKRDGTPVGTAVNIAVDGDHAFVRTWGTSGKIKRIRNNPEVEVAPSTASGKTTGPAIHARARIVGDDERAEQSLASKLIEQRHPFVQGIAVKYGHRLLRRKATYIELTPAEQPSPAAARPPSP